MSNSIRDNTKDILRDVLIEQGGMNFDQATEKAAEIADNMGLDSKAADQVGPAKGVIIAVEGGIAHIIHQQPNVKVVILDFDLDCEDTIRVRIS